jgi:TrmH family RNA methyltransferase
VHNPQVKQAVKLRERRARDHAAQFLIEGYRELKRAFEGRVRVETLFICPPLFLGDNEEALIDGISAAGADVCLCTPAVFEKLSYRDRPDGLMGVAQHMQRSLEALPLLSDPFFVVAEAVEKPGNLGTILRSADAAGVHGVIVCDRCTDIHNPNVVRASVGTLFTVPVVEANGPETLSYLRAHGIRIVATTPSAEQEFTEADLTGPLAIAVGTEQVGLTAPWMEAADVRVRIPMQGAADSLNVATATTLVLYEVVRQRRCGRPVCR